MLLVLLMLPLMGESARAAPGDVMLVSSDAAGTPGDNPSFHPSVSADGRYVAFVSSATNLIPGVTGMQVFRKDLLTGEIKLASCDVGGAPGNGSSENPSISSDCRYVAFESTSTNLTPGGTSNRQIFRKDLNTGAILLVSCNASSLQGNGNSANTSLTSDGRYAAFDSYATNLVTPATTNLQVFRKDLMSGEVKLVSSNAAGTQGDNASAFASIIANGNYVSFVSPATNLVPGVTGQQIYLKNLVSGEVDLVSVNASGVQGDGVSLKSSMSLDGRYVTFDSNSTNLVTPATSLAQIFRKDMVTGEVRLVSSDAAGAQGNNNSSQPSMSLDGRYVTFDSNATNLVTPATTNQQVYRRDLVTGEILLCSTDAAGVRGNGVSINGTMSPDCRYVAFFSIATNLVTPATTGTQIFRKELAAPYYFYFAEGYTGGGFQEYLCLGNPGTAAQNVKVTYLFKDGTTQDEIYNVPANSRFTVDVNVAVGADREVSVKCEASSPIVAERPMYFSYQGQWIGGHDVVGAPSPACSWYFAEGYTGAGFDEWICVLNPGDLPAALTCYFQTQEAGEITVTGLSVPAHTRQTFKANDLLAGGSYQTSLKLEADHPIVAERPMYFSYSGTGGWGWTGGSCVMGASSLANDYYFAEGTTRAGFEEWLTIQNPSSAAISVHAIYNLGSGAPIEKDYNIDAGRRTTIYVPNEIGTEKDASAHLSSDSYFLAERPMYFSYQGLGAWGWTGGHCVIGATSAATDWFFAEGYTGAGFEEWLCIQNPGTADAAVTITYYREGGTTIMKPPIPVPAGTRFTVPVNADAGTGLSISAKLSSNQPIIVERPMYFNFRDMYTGGHDVVGYVP